MTPELLTILIAAPIALLYLRAAKRAEARAMMRELLRISDLEKHGR